MPVLKIPSGAYINPDALDRLITDYLYRKAIAKGGLMTDPDYAAQQMHMVKEVWGKTDGKQLHHFILIFSEWESERIQNVDELLELGYHVCMLFAGRYQCVYAVHNNGRYHIHFVLNSVSYQTGEKFVHNQRDDLMLADYIRSCCIPSTFGHRIGNRRVPVYYD